MSLKDTADSIVENYIRKNNEYGNVDEKTKEIMKVLFPNGIEIDSYDVGLYITHIAEKLCRISTKNITSKALDDVIQDVAGYSVVYLANRNKLKTPL